MVMNQNSLGRSNEPDTPSSSELFTILQHRLRRTLIGYLSEHDRPIPLAELVTIVAEDDRIATENRGQLVIELHHNHLPRLSDCGLISYDDETNTVECAFENPAIEASLDLLGGSSVRM